MRFLSILLLLLYVGIANAQYYGSSSQAYSYASNSNVKIERAPGPRHWGPHPGCMMCLGNHLISHGYSYGYLNSIGWSNWSTLHDNAHNGNIKKAMENVRPSVDSIYAPTPQHIVDAMIRISGITKDDYMADLGCGDGRILIAAAKHGCKQAVGFEIDSKLVSLAKTNVEKSGYKKFITIHQHDMFKVTLKNTAAVTLYLGEKTNEKLVPKLKTMDKGSRVVSYAHKIPGLTPKKVYNIPDRMNYNMTPDLYNMAPASPYDMSPTNRNHKVYLYVIGE